MGGTAVEDISDRKCRGVDIEPGGVATDHRFTGQEDNKGNK